MKILTLVWSIGIGGTERAAVNYAIGYRKFNNDSRMLVLGEGHERYPDLAEAGVNTVLVTTSSKKPADIFNEFKTWSPDIIHLHNYHDSLLPYINLIKDKHTKVVETNVFSRPNFNQGYQVVDMSMQLSGWGYWRYERWMKEASYKPKTAIVPYIVDSTKFSPPNEKEIFSFLKIHNIPSTAFIVGRLGQPHPSKWDVRLLEVIKGTIGVHNNIYYLLVGLPKNLGDLFNQQTDFFKSRVIQIDKIEGDRNLSLYYHCLHCFAHLSKIGESFGYVLAEALVCKIPVVTMLTPLKDNAQYEVVGNGYGGFCVTNIKEFIAAILKLHDDKPLSASIKNNLTDWVQKRFSYNTVIPQQMELYHSLLKGKQLPPVNVSEIIKGNVSLYKSNARIADFLIRCANNPVFYKIMIGLKSKLNRSGLF